MEDWKPIPTFPNYDICSDGRIRNKGTGKYLKITWINGSGHVFLSYKGRIYVRSVAKLLEKLFGIMKSSRHHINKKCPNCGLVMGEDKLRGHIISCKSTRDPNIEYFEN